MPKIKTRSPIPQVPINHHSGLSRRQLRKGAAKPKVGLHWWQHWPLAVVLLLAAATAVVWWLAG